MKENLRSRNIAVNSYIGMLIVTIVGAGAVFIILHVAYNLPLQSIVEAAQPNFTN